MEPFALFQLLQSLFNAPASPAAPPQEPELPVSCETETPSPNAQEPVSTPSQEAVLRFLSEHETRAKRTKKP